jgi:hypothetical protein
MFVAAWVDWEARFRSRYQTVLGSQLASVYRGAGRLNWEQLFRQQEVMPGKDEIRNFLPFTTNYSYTYRTGQGRGELTDFRVIWGQVDSANRLQGVCVMVSADGRNFVQAEFVDGQLNGWHRWMEADGTLTLAWKKNGVTEGYSWRQEPNGDQFESFYRNGQRVYSDSEVPQSETDYFIEKAKITRVR